MSKFKTGLAASVAASLLACAVGVSAGQAAVFSSTGYVPTTPIGTQTIKFVKTGQPTITVTCAGGLTMAVGDANNSGSPLQGSLSKVTFSSVGVPTPKRCTSGTRFYDWYPKVSGAPASLTGAAGAYGLSVGAISDFFIIDTLMGRTVAPGAGLPFTASWTNGTLLTPPLIAHSRITLTDAAIATTNFGEQIRVSGVWEVKTSPTGGLITAGP